MCIPFYYQDSSMYVMKSVHQLLWSVGDSWPWCTTQTFPWIRTIHDVPVGFITLGLVHFHSAMFVQSLEHPSTPPRSAFFLFLQLSMCSFSTSVPRSLSVFYSRLTLLTIMLIYTWCYERYNGWIVDELLFGYAGDLYLNCFAPRMGTRWWKIGN